MSHVSLPTVTVNNTNQSGLLSNHKTVVRQVILITNISSLITFDQTHLSHRFRIIVNHTERKVIENMFFYPKCMILYIILQQCLMKKKQ